MCCKKIKIALRKRWIKWRFSSLHAKYAAKVRVVEAKQKVKLQNRWRTYQYEQMRDLIVCIDFRLYFIGSLLPKKLLDKLNRYKFLYFRRRDLVSLAMLADIVCNCDLEEIRVNFEELIKERKKSWIRWM